jgi:hypothetical protein
MEQTAEEIVATSDGRAVRMAFDERNASYLRTLLMLLTAFFAIALIVMLARQRWTHAVEDWVMVAFDVALIWSLGETRTDLVSKFIRDHLPAVIIVAMTLQSVLGLISSPRNADGAIPWTLMFPWFMLGFRVLPAELTLLHIAICATGVVNAMFVSKEKPPLIAAAIFMNLFAFAFGASISRRRRRDLLGVWRERRRHAAEVVRMRDELHYAREIQLSMLPDAPPALDWVDVAGISIPATEVGGDYYDYFIVGDRLAIVSGDVAGHGLASGIVLATLRSGFTLLRDSLTDPARVLGQLHDLVAETSRRRTLVTCAVLLLDRAERRATIANAGHPPVIVRRRDGVEAIDLFTPPLGVRLTFEIASREMPIETGDVFVLHTDGVYEATNEQGESYGVDRLVALIAATRDDSATALRDAIVHDVERFRAKEKQRDDVTVVVATIRAC